MPTSRSSGVVANGVFADRQQSILKQLRGAPLLVRSAPEVLRNGDVHYSYRQDSNFKYLTGFDEPESILLAIPKGKGPNGKGRLRTILFVRPRNPAMEVWDGERAGVRGAKKMYGADDAHPIEEFWDVFEEESKDWDMLGYGLGCDPAFDRALVDHFSRRWTGRPRRNQGLPTMVDPRPAIHEQRWIKSPMEIEWLQRASDISVSGHRVAMAIAQPGMYEYEVQAELEAVFRRDGSPRNGYDSIVASGANACTLHYIKNDQKIRRGDLLLIDAGAEYEQYSADITRTFPVARKFSDAQRAVYNVVLRCQKKCIKACKPGTPVRRLLDLSRRELTKGLVELGVLRGRNIKKLVDDEKYKPWYMHGLGHWLGMDVHDVGPYETMAGKSVLMQPGMVTTVEPGLYFQKNDKRVPKELRGIGVRIEDDVLITRGGCRVLSEAAPKEVRDVEKLVTGN